MGKELPCEVLHITEFLARLASDGRLALKTEVPLAVTYHDPCHLGRMAERFLGDWRGDKLTRPMSMKRAGRKGVYDAPRDLLRAIPGLELTEMERIREYSLCCGAGGGVYEAFPDFAAWAARERLTEAIATGAEALVTSCPWCEKVFREAVAQNGYALEIFDVADLVCRSTGK
jgi:Fe-S oxidoreductase